jgi:acetate kinase
MYILVINSGSSSLKYQLVNQHTRELADKGSCEKIGLEGSTIEFGMGDAKTIVQLPLPDHHAAIAAVIDVLINTAGSVISSLTEIVAVGHRVVHGGEYFSASVIIDEETIARIEECVPLAPLHNPAGLLGIRACMDLMPEAVNIAVFDTAFHQTMPARAFMYPLPWEFYEQQSVRRYGFHGTSHRYVSKRAAAFLQQDFSELKIITCHLGNGCSITAIDGGRSIDTSMGLTPLEGLMMGTRSGSIDPAIPTFLMRTNDLDIDQVEAIMNRRSGLLGVSGLSSDMRDVIAAAADQNQRAILALDMYAYSVRRYIGQYVFALGGVDAIVFTAGVGERSPDMRQRILQGLESLGIVLDATANEQGSGERKISTDDSAVSVLVIPTDEEGVIVSDVLELIAR